MLINGSRCTSRTSCHFRLGASPRNFLWSLSPVRKLEQYLFLVPKPVENTNTQTHTYTHTHIHTDTQTHTHTHVSKTNRKTIIIYLLSLLKQFLLARESDLNCHKCIFTCQQLLRRGLNSYDYGPLTYQT